MEIIRSQSKLKPYDLGAGPLFRCGSLLAGVWPVSYRVVLVHFFIFFLLMNIDLTLLLGRLGFC
jgi:hypothetical protein